MKTRDYSIPGEERYLRMTAGEQAIWASVYAFKISSLADFYGGFVSARTEAASRIAGEVITALRKRATETISIDDESVFFLRSMVNRRKADVDDDDEVRSVDEWLAHNGFKKTLKIFREESSLNGGDSDSGGGDE